MIQVARTAGWLPENDKTYPRVDHVKFGVVCGEDGKKFKTREAKTVPLTDLLDEAKTRSKAALIKRGMYRNVYVIGLLNHSVVQFLRDLLIHPLHAISLPLSLFS